MPKVNALTRTGKVQESIRELTRNTRICLADSKISYTQIAKVLDISPQAVSNQFRAGHITLEVYTTAQLLIREKNNEKKNSEFDGCSSVYWQQ